VKKYAVQGKHLRDLLTIDENSILSDRSIRNHFEHYGDRIEEWFAATASAIYIDYCIDPIEPTLWSLPKMVHRKYNPASQTLYFRNDSIDLAAVRIAIAELREKCKWYALP
jgi:hypothetical protein